MDERDRVRNCYQWQKNNFKMERWAKKLKEVNFVSAYNGQNGLQNKINWV